MLLVGYLLLLSLSVFLLIRRKLLRWDLVSAAAALFLLLTFLLRYAARDRVTGDYSMFLYPWVQFFRENGGFVGLGQPLGNYNVPYLYFLALFSYLPFSELHLIKLLSVCFDVLLAWSCLGIVSIFSENRIVRLVAFIGALFLPTVMLNGALWGQCDSIFTALAVLSLYLALTGKPYGAAAAIGASLAFKLQAVFVLPVFGILLFAGKVRFRHLLAAPAVYLFMILPAVFAGRPFLDTLLFYFSNATSAGAGLNYNSCSMYAFPFMTGDAAVLSRVGILAAGALVAAVYLVFFLRRDRITDDVILGAAALFAVGIPFLLPHMHDRYFFPADVLTFVYAMVRLRRFPIPFLVSIASLLGYHAYLRLAYFCPMWYGSAALVLALVMLFVCVFAPLFQKRKPAASEAAEDRTEASDT